MEQFGLVIETGSETATVTLQRHLTCESCGRCGILSGAADRRELTVEALNPIQAQKGQRVIMETDDRQILFLSFMLYMVPLAVLLIGIIIGLSIADFLNIAANELFAVGIGFFLMIVIYVLIRNWDKRAKDDPKYKPVITALINEEKDCEI